MGSPLVLAAFDGTCHLESCRGLISEPYPVLRLVPHPWLVCVLEWFPVPAPAPGCAAPVPIRVRLTQR